MGISSGAAAFQLAYQLSPIVLTGGLASNIPGGALPALALSQAISFVGGLLVPGTDPISLNDYFAYFQPLPGSTLIDQEIGQYPFANQQVAANATIQQPLTISMLMICPASAGGGYASKPSIMQGMVQSFQQHNQSGGLYTVLTPAYSYTNCVMLSMTDVSGGQTHQVQWQYKLDFRLPLVTQQQAQQAYNSLMNTINNNLPTNGAQTGADMLVNAPGSGQAPTFVPSGAQTATGLPAGIGMQ